MASSSLPRSTAHSRSAAPSFRSLLALVLGVLCGASVSGAIIPGQLRVHLVPSLDGLSQLCVLDGSGQGLTAITATDLQPFAATSCGRYLNDYIVAVDLSHNFLGATPGSFGRSTLKPLFGAGVSEAGLQVDLSFNAWTASTISSLLNNVTATTGCSLCATNLAALDLSYNNIGPAFPAVFANLNAGQSLGTALSMISCGITDMPFQSLTKARLSGINLALNDLSSGLHAHSFVGSTPMPSLDIFCAYCNLRTSSLPVGVFDLTYPYPSTTFTGRLNLANDILLPNQLLTGMYLPRSYVNDTRLFSQNRFTPPNAAAYVHRLPTSAEYLTSWSNCFVNFTASILTTAPTGAYVQPSWTAVALGDVVSFLDGFLTGMFLAVGAPTHDLVVTVDLAPHSAASALGLGSTSTTVPAFCPFHSLAHSLFYPWSFTATNPAITSLTVRAYDLPLPSASCVLPTCSGGCITMVPSINALLLPTEPLILTRAINAWLTNAQFADVVGTVHMRSLSYTPPRFALWNPALNQTSWMPTDLICDLRIGGVINLPGLPYSLDPAQASMPFVPPGGMLSCLTSTILTHLDWSSQKLLDATSLAGLVSTLTLVISLDMQWLYRGVVPVPYGLFDPLLNAGSSLAAGTTCTAGVDPDGSCARMVSLCPAWVNGVCVLCAPGFFGTSKSSFAYCSSCPAGFFCDAPAGVLVATPCASGMYQPLVSQSSCDLCPTGTYSSLPQQTNPSACIQCPPGRENPVEGGSSLAFCTACTPGTASAVPGAGECVSCAPGTYQESTGKFQCSVCPANTYQPSYGATNATACLSCPPLTPQSVAGSSSSLQCTAFSQWCPAGNFTRPGDLQPCTALCPPGSACVDGVVTQCPPGSYTSNLGMAACTACGAGFYGYLNGSASIDDCSPCQFSAYSSELVTSSCTLCNPGWSSTVLGAISNASCLVVPNCQTAVTLLSQSALDSLLDPANDADYCVYGGTAPIKASRMMQMGVISLHNFMVMAMAMGVRLATLNLDLISVSINALSFWVPIKSAPSLRMAAFTTDAILSANSATQAASTNTSDSTVSDPTKPAITDTTAYALFAVLMCVAFVPWLVYRWVPVRVALHADQFKMLHRTPVGSSQRNLPTQLGTIVTWSFLWVAILVIILLSTESNTLSSTELVPPSAAEYSGTAQANFQITLRVYTGDAPADIAKWCIADESGPLMSDQYGLTNPFTLKTITPSEQGGSCDVAADCVNCGMSQNAYISFALPFNAQLVEWELWMNSAQAGSWSRSYGVHTAPESILLPQLTIFSFSTIESYFVDARSAASLAPTSPMSANKPRSGLASRSGFEFNFVGMEFVTGQDVATFNPHSTVGMGFAFQKSDIVLRTQLTNKQTVLQILAVIASAVVSLFSIFGIFFTLLETHIWRRCGWPTGELVRVEGGEIELQDMGGKKPPPIETERDFDQVQLGVNPLHSPSQQDNGLVLRTTATRSDQETL